MTSPSLPRVLVVDDEEPILETMTFTFMDDYEVFTTTDPREGLEILDEKAPVAVVITDQRMPDMTGVEFLKEVFAHHPETSRIMLTGFADSDATVQAINEGHVYAYISKPWEPDQLKQLVKRAAEHHRLTLENQRLVEDLQRANRLLQAAMDSLPTGAIAVDGDGVIQAVNRPACEAVRLPGDPRGQALGEVLARGGLETIGRVIMRLAEDPELGFEDVDLRIGETAHRLRVSSQTLSDQAGDTLGRVILFREISHEPMQRRFDEIVEDIAGVSGDARAQLEKALREIGALVQDVKRSGIASPGMAELSERASRTQTAIQSWLDVDDALAGEDYPDAQLLLDRMRIASQRWPRSDDLPAPVRALAERVDAYYESGENSKQRVL
jgi:FixJ family two-component response regulator